MRIELYTLFFLLSAGFGALTAQNERYLGEIFDDVSVESDIIYAQNITVLTVSDTNIGRPILQPLPMDVYQPVGDEVAERPLVIYVHTGNFLPPLVNGGVTGFKTDSAAVEICSRLAKYGYVSASIDYRLGWNPVAPTQPERSLGLINAAYRGVQDVRSCIRYFKRSVAEQGNPYGIDTTKIVVWGEGTGGYVSLATNTLDDFAEIVSPNTTPSGKFLTDLNGDGAPDPMVFPPFNGDINGTSYGVLPSGDTLCVPNHVGYSSDFHLCVNTGGALGDISWLEADENPMIIFQSPLEQFAPYESAVLVVPTTGDPVVEVQGGLTVARKAAELGINDIFASVDDEFTQVARQYSEIAGHEYLEGLFPFNTGVNGAPYQWWDQDLYSMILIPGIGISYNDAALLGNPNSSPEVGRAYIDTIMGFYAPRAVIALGLQDSTTNTKNLDLQSYDFRLSPNPVIENTTIEFNIANTSVVSLEIVDLYGRTIQQVVNDQLLQGQQRLTINTDDFVPGIYAAVLTINGTYGNTTFIKQ